MNTNTHTNDSALSAQLAGESRQNLLAIYSDMHKDAYGFRPRHLFTEMSTEELVSDMEYFGMLIDANLAQEAIAEKAAIDALEARLASYMEMGAPDRATAMRWELDAQGEDIILQSGAKYDIGYYCYCMGLPYTLEPTIREWIGA
jgi:hypothetical protein